MPRTVKTPPTWQTELNIVDQGGQWIIGLDEVGRGCLAGPVTLGAAAFSADMVAAADFPEGLTDSKLLTPARREALVPKISQWAAAVATGESTNTEIDEWGISYCLGLAALRALDTVENALLTLYPDRFTAHSRVAVLLDGPHDYITPALHTFNAPAIPVIPRVYTQVKADQACASVSGASVFAKVQRDHYMVDLAQRNPQWAAYGWEKNKGYGSAAHRQALKTLGPTPYHRLSWHLV
ncbi:ribonuclease HII [Alloscardovia criceti]|uniref:ribonuclease HII n=1 Tax=Alloscardovia criceti TaxID=356828 RepID=UPI00035C44D1|nr:ribonuclease HII [Alloscardovia criceti]